MNDALELPICLFKNLADNTVTNVSLMTWGEFKQALSAHVVIDTGNPTVDKDCDAFMCVLFKPPSDSTCEWINGQTRRAASNVLAYYALHLDFDSGSSTADARKFFDGLEYALYTSYNNQRTPGVFKYRVILPFLVECPPEELKRRKPQIFEWLSPLKPDASTLATARIFYLPATSHDGLQFAEAWNCTGELLDWRIFEPEPEPEPVRRPPALDPAKDADRRSQILAELHVLAQSGAFDIEEDWFKLGGALFADDYSLDDFKALSYADAAKDCEKKWKYWSHSKPQMNGGYLINLIRKTKPDFLRKPVRVHNSPAAAIAALRRKIKESQ